MTQDETAVDETESATPGAVNCRHCGKAYDGEVPEGGDFLCASCDHYQDHMQCPTCGSHVRISLMPEDVHPRVHAPVRAKKEK